MVKPGETVGVHCIAQDSKSNVYVGDIYGERAQKFGHIAGMTPKEHQSSKLGTLFKGFVPARSQ